MEKSIRKYWPIFVLPTLAAFIIGFIWPFLWGIYLSLCKFTTVNKVDFVGLSNYTKIFMDDTFVSALRFTTLFTIASTLVINIFAFLIAVLLTRNRVIPLQN